MVADRDGAAAAGAAVSPSESAGELELRGSAGGQPDPAAALAEGCPGSTPSQWLQAPGRVPGGEAATGIYYYFIAPSLPIQVDHWQAA